MDRIKGIIEINGIVQPEDIDLKKVKKSEKIYWNLKEN